MTEQEAPYIITVFHADGRITESFHDTREQADEAWAALPPGVHARLFVDTAEVRRTPGRRPNGVAA
jgi:hypothetical protein